MPLNWAQLTLSPCRVVYPLMIWLNYYLLMHGERDERKVTKTEENPLKRHNKMIWFDIIRNLQCHNLIDFVVVLVLFAYFSILHMNKHPAWIAKVKALNLRNLLRCCFGEVEALFKEQQALIRSSHWSEPFTNVNRKVLHHVHKLSCRKEVNTNDHLGNKLLNILWACCWLSRKDLRKRDESNSRIIISITQMYKFSLKPASVEGGKK